MLQKLRSPAPNSGSGTSARLGYKLASWVSSGIYTAFFVSLDRCSCVKLDTMDIYEPVPEQSLLFRSHRPFSSASNSLPPAPSSSSSSSSAAATSSSTERRSSKSRSFPHKHLDEDDDDVEEDREET